MNVSLTAVVLFNFSRHFCLNFDQFLLKYDKFDLDSLFELKFNEKKESET